MEDEVIDALQGVSTATVQNQLFARGLRNTVIQGVQPLSPHSRFVAEAFTLRCIPAREDLDVSAAFEDVNHPQRVAVDTVPAGCALVVDSRSDASAATAGDILMTRLRVRGCAAFVSDGAIRDSHSIRQMPIPVFVRSVTPTTNLVRHHAVDVDVPIGCGGVAVYPRDVLVGDADGVVVIPRHLAAEVARAAVEQEALEVFLRERVAAGAPVRGTYPPSPEVRRAYEEHQHGDF